MEPEFQEIELVKAETTAQKTERLFRNRYHRSSDESLSLLHLERPQALQEVQTLIESHKLGKHPLDKFLINDRLEHYMMQTIGQLSDRAAANPADVERHLRNPKANVLSLVELNLALDGKYGIWGDVVKWQLSPERVENPHVLIGYQQDMRNPEFRKTNEARKREKIPLYKKPLQDLTDEDFYNLRMSQNYSRQDFTTLVTAIAIFQAAQKALAPQPATTLDTLLAEDRAEALRLVKGLHTALENPYIAQAVVADRQAKGQLAEIFNTLGIGRAATGNQPAAKKLEQT